MYLSRIYISNFRNFSELDVTLGGNVVVVSENRVGKSNLLYALRLIFDPTIPDSLRQLGLSDFWDGLDGIDKDDKIIVFVEINDFEDDLDVLAILTDFRLKDDPNTVRHMNFARAPISTATHRAKRISNSSVTAAKMNQSNSVMNCGDGSRWICFPP
jgi:predicted ATP-dependent endonuclease of OLD family